MSRDIGRLQSRRDIMTKTMLIDATQEEETRVAIVDDNNKLVEFDYESIVRKQLKGSIFLAKVTRVEPSLQAAFVNFGGNRHGFLPFSEIHPDYFRIPVADREALIAAQKEELEQHDQMRSDEDDDQEDSEQNDGNDDTEDLIIDDEDEVQELGGEDQPANDEDEESPESKNLDNESSEEDGSEQDESLEADSESHDREGENSEDEDADNNEDDRHKRGRRGRNGRGRGRFRRGRKRYASSRSKRDEVYDNDEKPFRFNLRRQYKIQEVIKRGQIMLIQVSKEERGNKGAAVTSYLSLPGRYCVLMPNSPRGGGVSRKIGSFKDRKRLRGILDDLSIPDGMSVIIRTAGVERTKTEIKRDQDYLTRLWNNIRELTLQSSAPALVYEEGNLIKRAIRDLYAKDIDDVQVAGETAHKTAKEFMKMLTPSHAKKVKEYKDEKAPLFHKYGVEGQIQEIGKPSVTLKSGGYLIINPTEALVSIDVNSGRATKERHIEETALKTNLEAADEVARQMRLRDLGGLVVIDFIDMEDRRNNRKVENRLREALSSDRARIQMGRISSFGLMELSRQRLNPSLTEAQFEVCPSCEGLGYVHTVDFAATTAIRNIEGECVKNNNIGQITMTLPVSTAMYILNRKRSILADIESRYGVQIFVRGEEGIGPSDITIETSKRAKNNNNSDDDVEAEADDDSDDEKAASQKDKKSSGRRRGRRGGRKRNAKSKDDESEEGNVASEEENTDNEEQAEEPKKTKRKKSDKNESKESSVEEPSESEVIQVALASNDHEAEDAPKDYEVVNEAPKNKKKGWWSKIMD